MKPLSLISDRCQLELNTDSLALVPGHRLLILISDPDFTQTPPIPQNPFVGSGIDHVTVSAAGTYTTVPSVTFSGTPTIVPSAIAQLGVQGTPAITAGGIGHVVGIRFSLVTGSFYKS